MTAAVATPPARPLDAAALRAWPLPLPGDDADKEARGSVLVVAGSREIPGSAVLAAQAALRAGAGKVVVATAASVALAIAVAVPEARVVGLAEDAGGAIAPGAAARLADLAGKVCALLVGPGMHGEAAACALALALRQAHPGVPMVLDAAALGAVSMVPKHGAPLLITPHGGEMAHLLGASKAAVLAEPLALARQAAHDWHAIVALKGPVTVVARPDGDAWQHALGDAGLATAGSGDVLAGIVAGLAARGATLEQAAAWGVVLHAQAGARLARRIGGLGYFASELAAEVPALLQSLSTAGPEVRQAR